MDRLFATDDDDDDVSLSLSHLMQDDSFDDDWDDLVTDFLAMAAVAKGERKFKWEHERLNWSEHVAKLEHENSFGHTCRMSREAFENLLELLRPVVLPNLIRSRASCPEPIFPELVLAIGIRWLAGGSHADLKNVCGLSKTSVCTARDTFLDAVIHCQALDIKFPEAPEELDKVRKQFLAKSSHGVMRGCVGAMDGLLAKIKCPALSDCEGNPRAHYSGHHEDHGLNVQAICDARLRFLFFAVAAPGKCGDLRAIERTSIPEALSKLPDGVHVVADAAYMLTEHVLVPFTGSNRDDVDKDTLNHFLSQLRIRIEMAFGRLTTKWGILQKKMGTKLENTSKTLEACARLHNFVIDQDLPEELEDEAEFDEFFDCEIMAMDNSPLGWGCLPTVEKLEEIPGTSRTRDVILSHISSQGCRRPSENLERRRPELHDIGLMQTTESKEVV